MIFNSDNYSPQTFIDYIIEQMKLENVSTEVEAKIRHEIERKLGNRVIETIVNAMDDYQMATFEHVKKYYPSKSDFEIIFMLLDDMPLLYEFMFKGMNDLADEILYDIAHLDKVLEEKKKVKK